MKWEDGRRSDNVEDQRDDESTEYEEQRGSSSGSGIRIGGVSGFGAIVIILLGLYFGIDPSFLMQSGTSPKSQSVSKSKSKQQRNKTVRNDEIKEFISVVLADTEDVWRDIFEKSGKQYRDPKLVLFSGSVKSACGFADAATGPFYCPGDYKVYLDTSFFDELKTRFLAPGDFAQAYVIAHEVGHHVQTLLGITQKVHNLSRQRNKKEANKLSVKLELQADCFAGVWANRADKMRNILEAGDVEEALNAASSVGDDRIQKQSRG
ncbi:MAG: flagellar biosynthesis protein FlgM, partial [Desulfobacteraceae bacterium IS3]